jgi:hypothetical protein
MEKCVNPLRRAYLLVPVVLLASALVPASASAAIKQATYAVKISGTQVTNWSYSHTDRRLDSETGREKIGEEVTTIQWTVHFRRVG